VCVCVCVYIYVCVMGDEEREAQADARVCLFVLLTETVGVVLCLGSFGMRWARRSKAASTRWPQPLWPMHERYVYSSHQTHTYMHRGRRAHPGTHADTHTERECVCV
jgi:hypothetical protein